ncbi:TPA: hypothetical protein UMV35_001434 [Stenotrophomonas maltophilia]|uniref:hypothetical protein n=1 Tax=Stenotrophomonas TaxID=40323 RepID=UPI0013D91B88|nr:MULTISPECIES: hypothetical protein [Stenotrophomonas]MBH1591794.1 hypothetical protein [Stenotrophomonas maltophilia]MDH2022887.1 hypothetical protein [Stenotrophomonas sp. GD03680]HEL3749153.1 hypothetical protein [Stenotrophomonas maltophilia]HEL3862955.1 hypothetical protein [Stenotrophomonas maltophilia]HEL4287842.1 hypothetical protein [Stenotrophomonas maltophilia]
MASPSPATDAHAILRAPDLDSAERAYLGLLPDLDHVDALTRRAVGLSKVADAARGYALSMTLIGLRLQELEMGEPCTTEHRQATLRSLRQAFSA